MEGLGRVAMGVAHLVNGMTPSDLDPMSTNTSSLSMRTTTPSMMSPLLRVRYSWPCASSRSCMPSDACTASGPLLTVSNDRLSSSILPPCG